MNRFFILLLSVSFFASIHSQIFVSTEGNDSDSGTITKPYLTITKAISVASAGDTIFVRGGTYSITKTISISYTQTGTAEQMYHLFAYNDEDVLLDCSAMAFGGSNRGISLAASYWHIKGLKIYGAGDNGMNIPGGSHNIIERCSFFENRDTGLQMGGGASYNQVINCDSYYNADPTDYGDADGFAPKLDVGTGNYFYGCRSWQNVDDGWDGYMRGGNDVTTTLENCWTWNNGYMKDGYDPGEKANGNGFKMGGGDNSNADSLMHHFILKNCVAFNNKAKGFDQNNNVGSMTLLNCTGYGNLAANFKIVKGLKSGQTLTVENCLSYEGLADIGNFGVQLTNSWLDSSKVISAEDFLSLADSQASAPRKADGSLPDIDFLHLAQGSFLIDAGTDIGLAFNGDAPDLGAFESDYITDINEKEELSVPDNFSLSQNYPNPFNPATMIRYQLPMNSEVSLKIYDILGKEVKTLVNQNQTAGSYKVRFDASQLASGVYIYRLVAGSFTSVKKMMLIK